MVRGVPFYHERSRTLGRNAHRRAGRSDGCGGGDPAVLRAGGAPSGAARTAAGYRQVQRDAVRRVQFILKAKELGFTLVAAKARAKVEVVDFRIRELRRVRRVLDDLIAACAANEETGECPILDALEQEPKSSDQGA